MQPSEGVCVSVWYLGLTRPKPPKTRALNSPEELERRLAVASKQQQKSEAELVREALEDKLGAASPVSAGAALLKLAELGKRLDITLPPDASAKHDDYLYGDRK
jgi:hypothetical protein